MNSQSSGTSSPGIEFFVCSTERKLLVLKRTAVPLWGRGWGGGTIKRSVIHVKVISY